MTTPEDRETLLAYYAHATVVRKLHQGTAHRLRRVARRAERELAKALDEEERARIELADHDVRNNH